MWGLWGVYVCVYDMCVCGMWGVYVVHVYVACMCMYVWVYVLCVGVCMWYVCIFVVFTCGVFVYLWISLLRHSFTKFIRLTLNSLPRTQTCKSSYLSFSRGSEFSSTWRQWLITLFSLSSHPLQILPIDRECRVTKSFTVSHITMLIQCVITKIKEFTKTEVLHLEWTHHLNEEQQDSGFRKPVLIQKHFPSPFAKVALLSPILFLPWAHNHPVTVQSEQAGTGVHRAPWCWIAKGTACFCNHCSSVTWQIHKHHLCSFWRWAEF